MNILYIASVVSVPHQWWPGQRRLDARLRGPGIWRRGAIASCWPAGALAGCVERLYSDPTLASSLAAAGFRLWQQRYAPSFVAEAYSAVYAQAVDHGGAGAGAISGKISPALRRA